MAEDLAPFVVQLLPLTCVFVLAMLMLSEAGISYMPVVITYTCEID